MSPNSLALNGVKAASRARRLGLLNACHLPLQSSFVYKARHSDVRIWPARRHPTVVILFICGNPGLIDYYTEFLSTIYTASPENYEVIGVGHEGHSPDHPLSTLEALSRPAVFNTRPLPTLQDQIDRKIAYVDEIRASYPSETKLVLIGHSVGGYICQEVIKARPDLIDSMVGLFPSLADIATTPNGLKLSPLFSNPAIVLVVAFLSLLRAVLPLYVLRWIVQRTTRQEFPASLVTTHFVHHPPVVAAALAMADDEMRTIKELDADFLKQYGDRITLYFAAGASDGWVGDETRVAKITTALDSSKSLTNDTRERWHICRKGMPHAFCLEHSNSMAHLCAEWVADELSRTRS